MKTRCDGKSVWRIAVLAGAALACVATAQAQTWKPERAVELIAPSGPGGGTDKTARLIQRVWQNMRAIEAPVNVINKPGGGNTVALTYLKQHAGDAHYLLIVSAVVLTSHIVGRSTVSYTDFTPIAQLNSEYVAFAVRSDSPLKSGADLLALAAPRRGAGVLATVLTWYEQGHDIVSDNFRNVLAPAGINVQQVRYWEGAVEKLARADEWKKDLEANLWENTYMGSSESRKYLDAQYAQLKQILTDLGLVK